MKKLIIVSGSTRVLKEPADPIPALQRFDGMFIRLIRKYYKQLRGVDVLVLSPVYGLVRAEEKIGFKEPIPGSWRNLVLGDMDILRLKESSLLSLQNLLVQQRYDEIYVNLGKNMLKIVEGFDKVVPRTTKITYSQGRGIGPKMSHMKEWIDGVRKGVRL